MRLLLPALALAAALAACDNVGTENARGTAVPQVAPPKLSQVEVKPPKVDRSTINRVDVKDPPAIDATQVDLHKQADGVVDILWAVDDSGSMKNERQRLAANFDRFIQELLTLKVDFQIGVTSTNYVDGGKLRGTTKIIKNTTPDPRAVFLANTTFPDSRARTHLGLKMSLAAVTPPNTNPGSSNDGFIRPKAALAIIVVTDQDDHSYGETSYFARAFRSVKGKGNENLVTFSIIGGTTPNGCFAPGEQIYFGGRAQPAFRYSQVAAKMGGVFGSICDASFETTLVQIAQALNTLRRVFPLSLAPVDESISVYVNGQPIARDVVHGWQFRPDTNSVAFLGNYVPPPGADVRIVYAFVK